MPEPIEIFRAGRHVATSGAQVNLTEADLDAIVAAYDPKVHEAPLVVGHPKDNDPAYGWVESLKRVGMSLFATPKQLDPAFSEGVRAGRWKKVSASLYTPDSAANPTKGSWSLRHVGFLGAQPPAVKGLAPVSFSDKGADHVTFAEADDAAVLEAIGTTLPDAIIAAIGAALEGDALEATKTALIEAVTKVVTDALELARGGATEPTTGDTTKADLAEKRRQEVMATLDGRASKLETRERELAERERKLRKTEHESFLEGLLRKGQPLPCTRELAVSFMELMAEAKSGVVSFGENEKREPIELFKTEFLAKLPVSVSFREEAHRDLGEGPDSDDASAVAAKAAELRDAEAKRGVTISTSEAVRRVRKGA